MHVNPEFSLSRAEAIEIISQCVRAPVPLARPVFIIAGYHSPLFTIRPMELVLRRCVTNPELVHTISSPFAMSLESASAHAANEVSRRVSPNSEIDIVGHSMGGLVGRMLLAQPLFPAVRRLFTLASPHQGAIAARFAPIDQAARHLHPDSAFLAALNSRPMPEQTECVCYARLYDWWVGARNCAPPGHQIHWLDADTTIARIAGHFTITRDDRILADCIRRLRNESPLSGNPGTPPRH